MFEYYYHHQMRSVALLFLLVAIAVKAQLPSDFRSEQVAMSLSEMAVSVGDTLEVEGIVRCLAADRSLPYSNYLYVECMSAGDSVLSRQKISCKEGGRFATRVPVEYEWAAGVYYLRAYTRLMMNFSADAFCVQPFLVGQKFLMRENDDSSLQCLFSVVGGRLLGDCMQRIAVCVRNDYGFPVAKEMKLTTDKGDIVTTLKTSTAGLAMLNFIPQIGTNYFLSTIDDINRFAFPRVETDGLQIQGDLKGSRIRYQINGNMSLDSLRLCTFDRVNGLTAYGLNGKRTGLIELGGAPEVVSLFLIDARGETISEATLSSPNVADRDDVAIKDTVNVGEQLQYVLPQTDDSAKVFVRLVADNVPTVPMEAEIKYLSDYESALPFPSESYDADCKSLREDIYTWLSSAHFKRFDIRKALREKQQIYRYMPEDNLTFGGTVTWHSGHKLKGGSIVAYNTETNNVYEADVDTQGRFRIAVDDFAEGVDFYVEAKTLKNKSDFFKIRMDNDTFPSVHNIAAVQSSEWQNASTVKSPVGAKAGFNNGRYFTLPSVEVKARIQSPYNVPTNKFYSMNYVDQEEIEKKNYNTLLDILQQMPGVDLVHNSRTPGNVSEREWAVRSRRGASTLNGSNELVFLVDGSRYDEVDNLMYMSAFEIKSVELLQAWQAIQYVGGAISGAILIKTRGFTRKEDAVQRGVVYRPIGLSELQQSTEPTATVRTLNQTGKYRLLLDVVTNDDVRSYIKTFCVLPK